MKKATLIRTMSNPKTGAVQAIYKLDPPLDGNEHVVVSAVNAMFSGPETYIFPATKTGKITDWGELKGSYRGGLSHHEALRLAGYTVVAEQQA